MKTKEQISEYKKEWWKNRGRNLYDNRMINTEGRYTRLLHNAKYRDKIVEISFEQYKKIVSTPCVYCGESEKNRGIDRVNSSGGYTVENANSCCEMCNRAKWMFNIKDFLKHIDKIYNYQHNIL